MDNGVTLLESLKALADEKRVSILRLLLKSDLCVGALAHRLGISKPAVSQHLQVLRKAGLITGQKRGYWTHYRVERPAVVRIAGDLEKLAATETCHETICRRIEKDPRNNPPPKEADMCRSCCQQPIKLQDKPETCSPEKVRECHGDVKEHPCSHSNDAPARE